MEPDPDKFICSHYYLTCGKAEMRTRAAPIGTRVNFTNGPSTCTGLCGSTLQRLAGQTLRPARRSRRADCRDRRGAVGAVGLAAVSRLARSILFGIAPQDPLTLGTTVAVLLTAVLAASWLPARRAARINPASAMRI